MDKDVYSYRNSSEPSGRISAVPAKRKLSNQASVFKRKRGPKPYRPLIIALALVVAAAILSWVSSTPGLLAMVLDHVRPCTLADQIVAANTDEPSGGCPAGDGAATIRLYEDITLSAPLPRISSAVFIEGNGHTIDGADRYRIFEVSGDWLHIKDLNLKRGRADTGGAILASDGALLILVNSTISDSYADSGGAITSKESDVSISDSKLINNRASSSGGALHAEDSVVQIEDGLIRKNRAAHGGGIFVKDGTLTLESTSLYDNTANEYGGGIFSEDGNIEFSLSELISNQAGERWRWSLQCRWGFEHSS